MPLSIKDPEADRLAWTLARQTGESITQVVVTALRERLVREQRKEKDIDALVEEVMDVARHCASLPLLDQRSPEEIIGYDEHGLPR